ncbi:MAG: hypothetical protein JOZ54_04570 [Acidobacteria bacterium]|nr:hypothetical protein [Acidobacteriota bacterium]
MFSEMETIDTVVDRQASLPHQVFRQRPAAFHVIDLDQVWSEEFFRDAQGLMATVGDASFTFIVLRPDSVESFHAHFGKFPILQFGQGDRPETLHAGLA